MYVHTTDHWLLMKQTVKQRRNLDFTNNIIQQKSNKAKKAHRKKAESMKHILNKSAIKKKTERKYRQINLIKSQNGNQALKFNNAFLIKYAN